MKPRLRVYLPPMSATQAIDLLDTLERLTEAIWRAYGDDLAAHPRLGGSTYPPDWRDPHHRGDDVVDF